MTLHKVNFSRIVYYIYETSLKGSKMIDILLLVNGIILHLFRRSVST